jgi:hypothetical protein
MAQAETNLNLVFNPNRPGQTATEHFMPLPGGRFWPSGYVATIGAVAGGHAADDSLVRLLVIEHDGT